MFFLHFLKHITIATNLSSEGNFIFFLKLPIGRHQQSVVKRRKFLERYSLKFRYSPFRIHKPIHKELSHYIFYSTRVCHPSSIHHKDINRILLPPPIDKRVKKSGVAITLFQRLWSGFLMQQRLRTYFCK